MKKIKIKCNDLDGALKKIKKVIKADQEKEITQEIKDELNELVSRDDYKCLRKSTRGMLKDFKAMPYSDQVDEFMDLHLLAQAFKELAETARNETNDSLEDAMDALADAIMGNKVNSKMENKVNSFINDPLRKKLIKCVKIAIAVKQHQQTRKNKD